MSNVTAAALTSLPVDQAALREGKDAKVPSPRARAGKAPKAGVASTLNSNGATNPTLSAVGRLYMTRRDGYPSTCSGTLIRNGVVLTAAHCVYNGPSVPGEDGYQRVDYFAPGQVWDGGSGADTSRYSYVTVNNWWAPTAWMQGDDGQDWALVLLDPYSNGLYPGEYTGTHDAWVNIQWNSGAHVYQAGYPAGGYFRTNFNGNAQWYCDSTWYRGTVGGYDAHRLPNSSNATLQHTCTMNGGASGGPTFVQLSDDSWVIAGVNNRGCCADQQLSNTVFDYLLVHYFDERVRTFYDSIFN